MREPGGVASVHHHRRGPALTIYMMYALFGIGQYSLLWMLVLFLSSSTASGGLAYSHADALHVFGLYAAASYCTPVLGGLVLARFGSTRVLMGLGASSMAAGLGTLSLESLLYQGTHGPVGLIASLILAACGTGLFKPGILTLVGSEFEGDDHRAERAFGFAWASLNVGSFLAGFVGGGLADRFGWSIGFASAALLTAFILPLIGIARIRSAPDWSVRRQEGVSSRASRPFSAVLVLMAFYILYSVAFAQIFGLMSLFIEGRVDRSVLGWNVPTIWITSLESLLLLPLVAIVGRGWVASARLGFRPAEAHKFALAFVCIGLAFAVITLEAGTHSGPQLVPLRWILGSLLLISLSEVLVQPVGMSLVSRLAPARYRGLFLGLWLSSYALASIVAAEVGAAAERNGRDAVLACVAVVCLAGAIFLGMLASRIASWSRPAAGIGG